jgi:leucyl-tRNA synthetase
VEAYVEIARNKSDLDRTDNKEKTGEFTGSYATNPVNGKKIPIWISDYVLSSYGTGAIMAVPAHDTRDFEFATKFNIPIICILKPTEEACAAAGVSLDDVLAGKACWTGEGTLFQSANDELSLDGLSVADSKPKMTKWLETKGIGKGTVNFKLRDWLFSRQRYWGEPFPLVHMEDGTIRLLDTSELPVRLPEMENYKPTADGEPPRARATEWLNYTDPVTGQKGKRETNTMPQWAGSCWYYLRYIDPHNDSQPWAPEKEKYWMPVDLYIGGAEHAVLHLLYSRFWHKVLYKLGLVSHPEPWKRLIHQGMILGISYKDKRGVLVPNDLVEARDNNNRFFHKETGEELTMLPAKMSKSLKNVVNPDEVIAKYGADSFRLYEMFMGPLAEVKPWNTEGVEGVNRFLNRLWRCLVDVNTGNLSADVTDDPMTEDMERLLHQTIKKVSEDVESLSYNTAISQLMIFLNEMLRQPKRNRKAMETFVLLISPMAPHIAEELWQKLGHADTLAYEPWPTYDESKLKAQTVEILVQVLGKPKARIQVPVDLDKDALCKAALENADVQAAIAGKTIVKSIAVPGRLVNFVVK